MLSAAYLRELGIESIVNYNRKSRQDEEKERKTGEDTLKEIRDTMDRVLLPLGIPYDQRDEIGSGDKISTRPVFQGVIEDLQSGKYQAIAVKEMSRMGRGSYTDMGIIYDLIKDKPIFVITPYKVYDPKNTADLRQIRFELFMSREEFETTRERLAGGRYNKAIEGRWMAGAPPFGYILNSATRKLEVHEEQAHIVRLIFDFYVNGIPMEHEKKKKDVGYRALSTYLKRLGIKSPQGLRDWKTDNLKYLLANPVYNGVMKYRTTQTVGNKTVKRPEHEHIVVENAHPAIIDPETCQSAQEKAQSTTYRPRVRLDHIAYELTGLVVCKVCGRKMIRQANNTKYTKKNGEVATYKKEFLWCGNVGCNFVKYRAIEEDLIETLKYIRDLESDIVETRINQMINKTARQNKSVEDIAHLKEKKMVELKQRMKFIYDKYESGKYSDEEFEERRAEVQKEMSNLERISATNTEDKADKPINTELIQKGITSLLQEYHTSSDTGYKNAILRKVFDHVVVEVIEKGHGTTPAKHVIYPVLKRDILDYNSLVL